MNARQCQLTIAEEGIRGPVRHQTFDVDDRLQVRDISTRATVTVLARELSAYRHTLFLEGKAYRILNILKRP